MGLAIYVDGDEIKRIDGPVTKESLLIPEEHLSLLKEKRDMDIKLDVFASFQWEKVAMLQEPDEEDLQDGYQMAGQRRLELLGWHFAQFMRQSRQVYRADEVRRLLQDAQAAELSYLDGIDPRKVALDDLDRLLNHEIFFTKFRNALYPNNAPYQMTVYFKDLTLVASEKNPVTVHPSLRTSKSTIWTSAVQLFCGPCLKMLGKTKAMADHVPFKIDRPILDRCSGIIRPGRLTLVLGPPGAGKTTLMRTLLGLIKTKKGKQTISGDVHYNNHNVRDLHTPNFSIYVDQIDDHIPILTTAETLDFAFQCKRVDVAKFTEHAELSDEDREAVKALDKHTVQFVLGALGLKRAAETIIGDDVMKGVSGGEKRRVTLGEMLCAGGPQVLFLDEISTGLDSAATFDITKALLSATRLLDVTIVVALLQPPPETFDLFDDVLLVDSGRIVYLGPREDIVPHFESLGFQRPPGKDVGDWLQEVTTKDGPQYRREGVTSIPSSTEEFVAAFEGSSIGKAMLAELEKDPQEWKVDHWYDANVTRKAKHPVSWWQSFKLLVKRQGAVMLRNKPFILATFAQNIVMGLLLGMLMFQLKFDEYYLKAMLMFQYLMFNSFNASALLGSIMQSRNVFYKQSKASFYPTSAYVLADLVVAAPLHIFDSFVLGSIIYFMCGLTLVSGGQHYFIFLVIAIVYAISIGQVVRTVGYVSPDENTAFAIAVVFVVICMFFSGGIATFEVIPNYWIWLYWISPMSWAYRSFQQNEYLSDAYTKGFGCCGSNGECQCDPCKAYDQEELNCGEYFLSTRQFQTEGFFMWTGVAVCFAYLVLQIFLSILGLKYVRFDEEHSALPVQGKPGDGEDFFQKIFRASFGGPSKHEHSGEHVTTMPSAIPFEQCELVFRDVVYTLMLPGPVDERGTPQLHPVDLLKGVSGYALPYRMTALMGSSGAGKTTLLDVLADRKTQGEIKGDFLINGKRKQKETFIKQMGYVEQFGKHCATATVHESLMFSAALRLHASVSAAQRRMLIDEQMELLELDLIKDKQVGTFESGGLSFEETKRLTIGVELAANPSILFLDEPTSGLDARAALIVMAGMRKVAATGRSLVCTIHQPSHAVFKMFDDLLLMRRGGEVVYFGELGDASRQLVDYFESFPGVDKCPIGYNPATWMLDVIGAGTAGGSMSLDFVHEYKLSSLYAEKAHFIGLKVSAMPVDEVELDAHGKPIKKNRDDAYSASFGQQIKLTMARMFEMYWRTPGFTWVRFVSTSFFSLILGSIFWQQEMRVGADVESVVALLNLHVMILGMYNAQTIIPFMYSQKALYYREKASNMYTPLVYALIVGIVEIPYVVVESSISVNILYWMVGLDSDVWNFLYFWLHSIIWANSMSFTGILFSFLMPNAGTATLVIVLYLQVASLFAGQMVPGALMPTYLLWLSYSSPMRWSTEGVVVTQFNDEDTPICVPLGEVLSVEDEVCSDGGVFTTAGGYVLGNPKAQPGEEGFPGLFGGPNGFQYSWRWYDIIFMTGFWAIVYVGMIVAAERISYEKR